MLFCLLGLQTLEVYAVIKDACAYDEYLSIKNDMKQRLRECADSEDECKLVTRASRSCGAEGGSRVDAR